MKNNLYLLYGCRMQGLTKLFVKLYYMQVKNYCFILCRNIILLVLFLCAGKSMLAQPSDSLIKSDNSTFTMQINQDNTFGFFPMIIASIGLKKADLTFYTVFWTSPVFANADGSGSLIETGIGVGFSAGNWYINPSLGFTHGFFTNGRDQSGRGRPTIAEAIVPGATLFFKTEKLESEFFTAYYHNLRKEISPQTNYLLIWLLPGFKLNKYFSSGLHYEQFRNTSDNVPLYERYGLYFKTTFKEKYELRLAAGLNYLREGDTKTQGDFYKLTVNIPF